MRGRSGVALPRPPAALAAFQRWFGGATSRPLLPGNGTRSRGADGPRGAVRHDVRREAVERLRAHGGMDGFERLAVYNRQYWFRLIAILQEEFPCALHVIGLDAFNKWATRYLLAHPPRSPYLADMDREFPGFLRRRYRGGLRNRLRDRLLEAAGYDGAFSRVFDAPAGAPPDAAALANPRSRWTLAPRVKPLWLHWDFAAFRESCREDESLTARIPLRRKGAKGHGLCLHVHAGGLYEKPLSRAEFLLLRALETPRTLAGVFRAAARGAGARERAAMERNATAWFREWTELGWIGTIGEGGAP